MEDCIMFLLQQERLLKMLKIQINSNATSMLQNIINKVDTFPNMIASAQNRAINRTVDQAYGKMYRYGMGASYITMDVDTRGKLGAKIIVKPEGQKNSKEYIAGSVFLEGRKGGKIIRPKAGKKAMKLRDKSVQEGYPQYLAKVKLKGMKGFKSEIKRDLADLFLREVQLAVRQVGFGPKGGAPAGKDFTAIRQRFPKRSG